ncbi:(Fe-S)-binding protein [Candidatus Riflebacteria bacterium]
MLSDIFYAVSILVGLGLTFGTILAVAYKKLRVIEDPRIDNVEEMLPGSNCGACGFPGCRAFAEKLVENGAAPSGCTVSSPETVEEIAGYLGVSAGVREKKVARLLCAGGIAEAPYIQPYIGLESCGAATVVTGGNKSCVWGCLGLADCEVACTFSAIHMNENGLPLVEPDLCTACGDCVVACPKNLFVIMPVDQKLIVQCRCRIYGDKSTDNCSVACTACGLCAVDAAPGVIEMKDNLPVVDYSKNELIDATACKRCPTGAITWVAWKQFQETVKVPMPLGRVELSLYQEEE